MSIRDLAKREPVAVTLLVEPNPVGHRFQSVAMVARVAARDGKVLLLTKSGARADPAYAEFLEAAPIDVVERFDSPTPSTRQLAREIAALCRTEDVSRALVLDADQCLKRWWFDAPTAFRSLGERKPRVLFMLTRYPALVSLTDGLGWSIRISKACLAALAMATGSLHLVSAYTGRADLSRGWLVKRVRDPAICGAHSRDRDQIRAELDLPADRALVGIFGVITRRKFVPLVLDAVLRTSVDADLLLAGTVDAELRSWLDDLPQSQRSRVLVRHGFLSDHELDRAVAAVDVVALAMTNNGPSGIMGKALAAEVPVVTAGSRVRARELRATNIGEATALDPASFAVALERVLTGTSPPPRQVAPPTSPTQYAECLLGLARNGVPAAETDAFVSRRAVGNLFDVHPRVRAYVRQAVLTANTPLAKARMTRAAARVPRPIKLEIGGTSRRDGWLVSNVNATARYFLDATNRWPFEDASLSHVYADNVIEHITLDQGRRLLAEAYRCLRPGGVIRLVTPDIRAHVELYLQGLPALSDRSASAYRDRGELVEHPVDLVRIPIGCFGHYLGYVYDFQALESELTRVGFLSVVRCELGESQHPAFIGLDKRTGEGGVQLAVEAIR